ncbi:MAG: hypothetical protein FI692_07115 [SAR202 cluster bacterium]|nr:hypothetical protein [SAR202 cluster bacterium]|tara:strand:- start:1301 stop:1489 length:189 start_codon:yes stop_codon:yes gene_type:complete
MDAIIMTVYNDDGTIKEIEISKVVEIENLKGYFLVEQEADDYKALNAMSAMPEYFNDQLDPI